MKVAKRLAASGFIIGGIGFLIAVVGGDRVLAMRVFTLGFIIAAIGIVATILVARTPEGSPHFARGIKFGAIGFGICTIGVLASMFIESASSVAEAVAIVGLGVMCIGVFIGVRDIVRDH